MRGRGWAVLNTNGGRHDNNCRSYRDKLIGPRIGLEDVPAVRIHGSPIHASQVIRPSVRILLVRKPKMAATATKTAVQAPLVDTVFRPMEMPRMPEPVTKIQSVLC